MSFEPTRTRHLCPVERRPDERPRTLPTILPILRKDVLVEKRRPDIPPTPQCANCVADGLRVRGMDLGSAERFHGECGAVSGVDVDVYA